MSSIKLRCLDDSNNSIFVVDSTDGVTGTNTKPSTNATTGGLLLYGGVSIAQTSNASSVSGGGSITIAGGAAIAKDLYVGGNIISNNLGSTTASANFGQISVFGTQDALNYSTGSIISAGGITINDSANATSVTAGGAFLVAGGASVAKDVYIGGNLTVIGSQTSITSQTLNIGDNLVVVNSGPSTTKDAGVLVHRYQTENNTAVGDVVADTAAFTTTFVSASGTTAVFNTSASASDNFYNNWYIRVTSGTGINQVRRIVSYTGGTRTALLGTAWNTAPSSGDAVSFFNRAYASQFYQESTDRFVLGYTVDDPGSSTVTVGDFAGLAAGAMSVNSTVDATGVGSGGALTVTGGGAISNRLFVGGGLLAVGNTNTIGNLFTTGGDVGVGVSAPLTRLSITSSSTEPKITLWDNGSTVGHFGFGVSNAQLNYHVFQSTDSHVFFTSGKNGDGTEIFRIGSNTASLTGNINSETGMTIRNTNSGSNAFAVLRVDNDTANDATIFLNSSTKTSDGGINTCTMRNDAGSLRLLAAGGANGIWISSTSGNVGINTTGPTYTLDVAGSFEVNGVAALINDSNTVGNLYTTGGNVGINMMSPTYQLDVNGSANINGDLSITGFITGGGSSSSTFAYLTLTATDEAVNLTTGSMVTFGGVTIQAPTDATSVTSGGALLTDGGAAIGKRLFVRDGIVSVDNSNTIGGLIATSTGNIGIGTTSPQTRLDVNGAISAANVLTGNVTTGNLQVNVASIGSLNVTSLTTGNVVGLGTTNTLGSLFTSGGNVGIGNTSPQTNLDVSGSISSGSLFVNNASISNLASLSQTVGALLANSNVFITGGSVGVGTTSPTHQLHITRTALVASTQSIGDTNITSVTGGALNVSGDIVVAGTRGIHFVPLGFGAPTFTNRSLGTKINLWPQLSGSSADYALGVLSNNMWIGVPSQLQGIRFYQGITNTMTLNSYGNLIINATSNSTGVGTGGALTIAGGTSIANDLYVGGTSSITGVQTLSSTQGVGSTNISTASGGGLNVSGDITVGGTRGIHFVPASLAAPSTTTRSIGTKLNLWPLLSESSLDYAIGIEANNMWFSASTRTDGFKWYQNTFNSMQLASNGNLFVNSTTNSTGVGTGGALTVAGGTSIANDLYVGGTLTVNGQNLTTNSGNSTVGSYTGTGVYTISNIPIGRTMGNANYKIIGSLRTTSTISNVYVVSFSDITTTTFDANILRLDSLFSGWTDPNLILSWQILP